MSRSSRIRLAAAAMLVVWLCLAALPAFADGSWTVGTRDVRVTILPDGSADVVERISLSMQGGLNNVMFRIAQSADSPVEIQEIKIIKNDEWVNCAMLSAGQWDAQVFSGTYAVVEKADRKEVTVYGSFNARKSHFLVSYRIANAVRVSGGRAVFRREVVLPDDPSANRDIHVQTTIPASADASVVESDADFAQKAEGVFVSECTEPETDEFLCAVPDTVPGEYLTVTVAFPLSRMNEAALLPSDEESEATPMPNAAEMLKAREKAAARYGAEAHAANVRRKMVLGAKALCLSLSAAGLLLSGWMGFKAGRRRRSAIRRLGRLDRESALGLLPDNPEEAAWLRGQGRNSVRVLGAMLLDACERDGSASTAGNVAEAARGQGPEDRNFEGDPKQTVQAVRTRLSDCVDRRMHCAISMLMPIGSALMLVGLLSSVSFSIWAGYVLALVAVLLLAQSALLPDFGETGWMRFEQVRRSADALAARSGAFAYACRKERRWLRAGGKTVAERARLLKLAQDRLHALIARNQEMDFN